MTDIKEISTSELKEELSRLELEVVKDDSVQMAAKILMNS